MSYVQNGITMIIIISYNNHLQTKQQQDDATRCSAMMHSLYLQTADNKHHK